MYHATSIFLDVEIDTPKELVSLFVAILLFFLSRT